jgi:hypothetical protein
MLKEIKLKFVEITGMPAKKAFADVATGGVEDRKMRSTADWEWAVENILPRFKAEQQNTICDTEEVNHLRERLESVSKQYQREVAQFESVRQKMAEEISALQLENSELKAESENLKTDEEIIAFAAVSASDEVVEPLFESLLTNDIGWYKKLSVVFHPDTTKLDKNKAAGLFNLLTEIYKGIKNHESESKAWGSGIATEDSGYLDENDDIGF